MLILNVNKLFCLNTMRLNSCLRLIYETENQIHMIKDIDLLEDGKNVETRVLSINTDFIKIKNQQELTQKHTIKIFKIKKSLSNKGLKNQSVIE